jgi:hypothetical protein
MIVIVDDIVGGTRAYRVEYFTVDVNLAVLRPVFGGGKTIRDFPGSSYRLTHPGMERDWLYRSAQRLLSTDNADIELLSTDN